LHPNSVVLIGIGNCNFNNIECLQYWVYIHPVCFEQQMPVYKTENEGVSKSFRNGRLDRKLQMVQLSVTRCSCIAILWVSLVSFATTTLCVASQRVSIVVHFLMDSVRKLLHTPSYLLFRVSVNVVLCE
jgi:hypothetical protein